MVDKAAAGAHPRQLEILPALAEARARAAAATSRTTAREKQGVEAAATLPVARVLVDLPLPHLDRPFDYLVPAALDEQVVPGARVKVRFAGQDVDGFVVERVAGSDHPGRLTPLRRAVSAEPVLAPEVARLCALVAERYAGTRADVLRLAVPPRHARVEKQPSTPAAPPAAPPEVALAAAASWWGRYSSGQQLPRLLASGESPRAVWSALPGDDWATGLAHAAAATAGARRGVILCVPDRRDLDRLHAALEEVLGAGRHVLLTADLGPAQRYRSFLAVSRGSVRVVAGTRAAAFAPVRDLGLVALWDDGDDLYAEPRTPYPHTREVLLLRAHDVGCGALLGGFARTAEAASLVATGWAREIVADRAVTRAAAPLVAVTGATDRELERDPLARSARLPSSAHAGIRAALEHGPVLVQTPRTGYLPGLTCNGCRAPLRCRRCSGPVGVSRAGEPPACRWCGQEEVRPECPRCGAASFRAPVVGERRTAEELGRAFPGVPVRRSASPRVLAEVAPDPAIVVATPGAEPAVHGGYAAVVLLDTWLTLARADLRTTEEAVRRWFNAASLARPAARGGRVVAVGEPSEPALQALVRWDPAGFAERELEDRWAAHLPPASRVAVLSGAPDDVAAALAAVQLPEGAELLGPVPLSGSVASEAGRPGSESSSTGRSGSESSTGAAPEVRAVLRVPRRSGTTLSRALLQLQGVRSARKLPPVRVEVDPYSLS